MLFNAVIIVLREVLEAALLASILLAMSKILGLSLRWFVWAVLSGLAGAVLYAMNMSAISELREYTGQEVFNGLIQLLTYLFALLSVLGINRSSQPVFALAPLLLILTVTLAMTREGAEIFIYLQGFVNHANFFTVITGALIGAAIGTSVGVIVFYILTLSSQANALLWCQCMLAVVAAGLLGQVIPLFEQIDLVPASNAVWNTSSLLPEDSVLGQLLYAIAGYEATPSLWHLLTWLVGMLLFAVVIVFSRLQGASHEL